MNSVNPFRIEGQKTASFEIVDQARLRPGHPCPPGRQRRQHHRVLEGLPRVRRRRHRRGHASHVGLPAAGAAPIVLGHPVPNPETIATAIRIGNPASRQQAVAARDDSDGVIEAVTDDEILAAYRLPRRRRACSANRPVPPEWPD